MNEQGEIKKFSSQLEAEASGFPFKISDYEAKVLEKVPAEHRVCELAVMRYIWVVLEKKGTRKAETLHKIQAKNAIRFAFEFVKMAERV